MSKLFLLMAAMSLSTALGEDKAEKSAAAAKPSGTPMMLSFAEMKWTELLERKGMQFAVLSFRRPEDRRIHADPEGSRRGLTIRRTRIAVNSRM